MLGGIAALLLVYLLVVGGLYLGQRSLLYVPDRERPPLGALAELGVREVTLSTADGLSLLAWYRPPPAGAPVLVYFHGNGGHLGYRTNRMTRFAQEGLGVLMLEYRGYGGNPGSPTEAGLYADAAAAFDFLSGQGIAANRLVIYGESLGAAIAVHAAAERKIGALVLEAPFTTLADAAFYHYPFLPVSLLLWDRFDSLSAIARVAAPVLILQGERDRVVPIRFGRALLAAAHEPKEGWFSPDAGHYDLSRFGGLDAMFDFLARRIGFLHAAR
ncbi:MAG TPA: alpha/beta hydrolase [Stellaceae bacterium]|nr:alpha/beta hydrolase [Stellaceae bacterium]